MATRLLVILLFSLNAIASEADLEKILKITKSFRGQFVQKVSDQDGNTIQEVKGHMLFKKPNFFKWVYSEPFKNQIINRLSKASLVFIGIGVDLFSDLFTNT